MPKFFAKVPFWIWSIIGLICLALSVPGFIAGADQKARQEALSNPNPNLIDLEEFDVASDIGPGEEVNIFAQTNPSYRFLIDGIGVSGGNAVVVPLFSVYAGPKEASVGHVILADDLERFEAWLEKNVAGTARMGSLYEINGEVVDGKGFTAAIRVTLRDAGLEQVDPLVIIKPFVDGRVAALSAPTGTTYGNPFVLAGSGAWMIWFGFVIWSRVKAHKQSVSRRIGEIGERTTADGSANLSRLKRTSQKLAAGKISDGSSPDAAGPDPSATPAE